MAKFKKKIHIFMSPTVLWDEINYLLFMAELDLMNYALESYGNVESQVQSAVEATYFRLRTQEDTRIDVDKIIAAQFDLISVCNPVRLPAFFEYRGQQYPFRLEKLNDE